MIKLINNDSNCQLQLFISSTETHKAPYGRNEKEDESCYFIFPPNSVFYLQYATV